jgi:glycosyltransferase involved in cell wall biosynthesis
MNILLLTHSYPDIKHKWRGVFIQEQVKALSIKHDITVVYFKVDYSHFAPFSKYKFEKKTNGTITEYEVTINKSFPVINQLKYLLNTYRFIKEEILNKKPIDIIHSHLSYPAGFLGTIIQKRKKIPNILTEHTWIKKYFRSWIHKICVLYTLKNSTRIVSVSKALKDDINLFCKRGVLIIPNVVDVERFHIPGKEKKGTLNIGILGGMGNYRKGLDILLKSVSLLKEMDLLVHIAGDGIYLDTFKKMSQDLGVCEKCKFYGELLPSDINNFYSVLDIFVLASRDETFGVVVVEAMACGLPVIATKCGGPEEIITFETGVLVEKENPEELARAIVCMSENIGSYNKDLIRKYAEEKYGRKAFVENATKLYQNVLITSNSRHSKL